MLAIETTFPNSGATGFLKPHGEEVRIIQHRPDGEVLVQRITRNMQYRTRASGIRTVPMTDLVEQRIDAFPVRRGRKLRK